MEKHHTFQDDVIVPGGEKHVIVNQYFTENQGITIVKVNSRLPPCGVQFAGGRVGVGLKGLGANLFLVVVRCFSGRRIPYPPLATNTDLYI